MYKDLAVVFLGDNYYYNLGFLKAIKENDLYENFKATTGTSLGALFSILFANSDYNSIEEVCSLLDNINKCKLNKEFIFNKLNMYTINKNFRNKFLKWAEIISNKGIIKRQDLSNIFTSENVNILYENEYHMDCYNICYELPFMGRKVEKVNDNPKNIKDVILNSIASPVVFHKDSVKTRSYITSDVDCKAVIDVLKEEGYKKILVVNSEKDRYNVNFNDNDILEITNNTFESNIKLDEELKSQMIDKGYKDTVNFIKCSFKNIA